MKKATTRRLKEMGFRLALDSCTDSGCGVWSRTIEYGIVRSIVSIRVTDFGFDYHHVFCPVEEEERAGTQWFDDPDPRNAQDCFRDTWFVLREAKEYLEVGIVRRSMRELLKKVN